MRKRGFEINLNVLRITRLFMVNPAKKRCGYDVAVTLEMHVNTVYDILERLEQANWLSSIREPDSPANGGRPMLEPRNSQNSSSPRRLFRITGVGHEGASRAFAAINFAST